MEMIVNALMLRAIDYKENDKILTLLTAERGKITAVIRGVKKAAAKLKFAAQPFCFAEYVIADRGGKYTVINASENESFYDLRTDFNKFYAASAAMEAAVALTYDGDECRGVFYAAIKALSDMCVGNESQALITFLLCALQRSGYGLRTDDCPVCKASLLDKQELRFDIDAGMFTCAECGTGPRASVVTYNVIRKTDSKSYKEEFITPDGEKRALKLLREFFYYKLNIALKSLTQYIRLL